MQKTTVLIAGDHRGFGLKGKCIEWLGSHGHAPLDLGTHSEERCDALDFAKRLAEEFKSNPDQFGILICGSGQAMAMTANRYRLVRAALCFTPLMAVTAREHNDANVLAMGTDFMDEATALSTVEAFLATKFLGGKYAERRDKLMKLGGL